VLYGSGNAKCSSIENVGRGLPNDNETRSMRDTWTAYKAATEAIEPADRQLFEHVILRNNYRKWMRLGDVELVARVEADRLTHVGIVASQTALRAIEQPDNQFQDSAGRVFIKAERRELCLFLRVIHALSQRMPQELRANPPSTGYTAMSEAQRSALDGDQKLCELYAKKVERSVKNSIAGK